MWTFASNAASLYLAGQYRLPCPPRFLPFFQVQTHWAFASDPASSTPCDLCVRMIVGARDPKHVALERRRRQIQAHASYMRQISNKSVYCSRVLYHGEDTLVSDWVASIAPALQANPERLDPNYIYSHVKRIIAYNSQERRRETITILPKNEQPEEYPQCRTELKIQSTVRGWRWVV